MTRQLKVNRCLAQDLTLRTISFSLFCCMSFAWAAWLLWMSALKQCSLQWLVFHKIALDATE